MKQSPAKSDYSMLLILMAIFVFHSPFTAWWAKLALPWYSIFVMWLGVIVLAALNHNKNGSQSED